MIIRGHQPPSNDYAQIEKWNGYSIGPANAEDTEVKVKASIITLFSASHLHAKYHEDKKWLLSKNKGAMITFNAKNFSALNREDDTW